MQDVIYSGFRRIRQALKPVRIEEWILLLTFATGFFLCLGSLTGFDFSEVFMRYIGFFSFYIVLAFAGTRVLFWLRQHWSPKWRATRWVHDYAGGKIDAHEEILKTDLEFLRGLFLLAASLTVYSNVKVRIPFINEEIYDDFFLELDHLVFGENFAPWLVNLVAENPALATFLERVYLHDYKFMVILVFLFYIREERFHLRWLFLSVGFTYLFGIFFTIVYPTMGPVFLNPEPYEWLVGSSIHNSQLFLADFYQQSFHAVAEGEEFTAQAFAGIAAFPSMHIAHMTILTVVAARTFRWYAVLMAILTCITFAATVAFGWHYATCALGGVLFAVPITEGLYHLMKRWDERRESASTS